MSSTTTDRAKRAREDADVAESRARKAQAKALERSARASMAMASRLERMAGSPGPGERARQSMAGLAGVLPPSMYGSSYPATQRPRTRAAQIVRGGAPDAHLDEYSLRTLREDSRTLVRSNPVARAMVRQHSDMVVGLGPTLTPRSSSEEFNAKARELWNNRWTNRDVGGSGMIDIAGLLTGPEMLRCIAQALLVDGDVLVLKVQNGSRQLVSADRMVSLVGTSTTTVGGGAPLGLGVSSIWSTYAFVPGRGGVVNGLELGPSGEITGFRVADYDQAGQMVVGAGYSSSWGLLAGMSGLTRPGEPQPTYRTIPAQFATFIRNPALLRVGQLRGEPALAAVIERFEQLESIAGSVRLAYHVATCFAAIITSSSPAQRQADWQGLGTAPTDPTQVGTTPIEPGMMLHVKPGEDVKQVAPQHPSANYRDYVLLEYSSIAVDLGLPWIVVTMDASQSNYSGFRAAIALCYEHVYTRRQSLEDTFVRPDYRWAVSRWIRSGLLPFVPDWDRVDVTWPPMPNLDPKSEIEAQLLAIGGGLKSRSEGIREISGRDPADVDRERAEDMRRAKSLGLPTTTSMPGAAPQATGQASTDNAANGNQPANSSQPAGAAA